MRSGVTGTWISTWRRSGTTGRGIAYDVTVPAPRCVFCGWGCPVVPSNLFKCFLCFTLLPSSFGQRSTYYIYVVLFLNLLCCSISIFFYFFFFYQYLVLNFSFTISLKLVVSAFQFCPSSKLCWLLLLFLFLIYVLEPVDQ